MKIKVYDIEQKDGIGEAVASNNSVSYCSQVEQYTPSIDLAIAKTEAMAKFDLSLYYATKSILATTSWNKNDDVFGPLETWAARHTPVHSPTNIDHDHKQIVGHITDAWVIDAKGNLISDDTKEEDLPSKFHLCNGAVIYKYSREKDIQARAEKLISEIESKEKFVSMECLFPNFGYAVISPENEYYIVERNESTAFLTKHLRIYGGKGSYNGCKIGRFLMNMVFSGKGYVNQPANPESIIFDSEANFEFSKASHQDKWFEVNNKTIVAVPEILISTATNTENDLMADETKLIDDLKSQVANLQKQLTEVDAKALRDEITELQAELVTAKAEKEAAKKEADDEKKKYFEKDKAAADLNTKVEELTVANAELTKKVEEAAAIKIQADRVSALVEGGVEKSDAEAKVATFANLNDEQFKTIAAVILEAVKAPKADATATTADEDGTTVLDGAQASETVVTGSVADAEVDADAVKNVRLSIANIFGYKTDNKDGE
jgi:hypothetical protein